MVREDVRVGAVARRMRARAVALVVRIVAAKRGDVRPRPGRASVAETQAAALVVWVDAAMQRMRPRVAALVVRIVT